MSQGLAILCFVIVRNAVGPVVYALEIDPEIIPITLGYVDAITFGLPAVCAYTVLRYFSEGVSMTRPVMFVSMAATVTNIGANYVFMYGKLGFPAMGAVGCGWASAVVMWLMFFCMLMFVLVDRYYEQFSVFCFVRMAERIRNHPDRQTRIPDRCQRVYGSEPLCDGRAAYGVVGDQRRRGSSDRHQRSVDHVHDPPGTLDGNHGSSRPGDGPRITVRRTPRWIRRGGRGPVNDGHDRGVHPSVSRGYRQHLHR